MIQLHYLQFAEKQLPGLNFDNQQDLIKVEKILKTEAKLSVDFNVNDIEKLIDFLKSYGSKFLPFFRHKNIEKIIKADGEAINLAPFNEDLPEETFQEFRELFEANTLNYLKNCIQKNRWASIKSVFKVYPFLLTDYIVQEILDVFVLKNRAIIDALRRGSYTFFLNQNPYAEDSAYFSLLSDMDGYYFEEDLLNINNIIAEVQRKELRDKAAFGRTLYAATFYTAFSEDLSNTLSSNRDIAYSWIYPALDHSSSPWTTTYIIIGIVAFLVAAGCLVFLPGGTGGGVWVAVVVGRLIYALRSK